MGYGDDDDKERLESKVNLLLKLADADVSSRLVTTVLENLTPAEKKELTRRVLAAAEKAVDEQANRAVDSTILGWVNEAARNYASSGWKNHSAKITASVDRALAKHITEEGLSRIVDSVAPNAIASFVKDLVAQTVRKLRA